MGQQHPWSGAEGRLERSKDLPWPIASGPGLCSDGPVALGLSSYRALWLHVIGQSSPHDG